MPCSPSEILSLLRFGRLAKARADAVFAEDGIGFGTRTSRDIRLRLLALFGNTSTAFIRLCPYKVRIQRYFLKTSVYGITILGTIEAFALYDLSRSLLGIILFHAISNSLVGASGSSRRSRRSLAWVTASLTGSRCRPPSHSPSIFTPGCTLDPGSIRF